MLGAWREAGGNRSRENLHAGTNRVCCSPTVWEPPTVLQALGLWELQIFKGLDTERLFWSEQTQVNISTDTSPVDITWDMASWIYVMLSQRKSKVKKTKTNKPNKQQKPPQTARFGSETEMVFDQNNMFGDLEQSWIPRSPTFSAS